MATLPVTTQITPSFSQFSPDQQTVVLASISCLVFFVAILVLLSVLYQRHSFCCKIRTNQDCRQHPDTLPHFYNSRQSLVAPPFNEQGPVMAYDNAMTRPGQLFLTGQPSNYQWYTLETSLPYLPSYMSVRKKDRQEQIHTMIAERFGLSSPVLDESPPTYEVSIGQSMMVPRSGLGVPETASASLADSHLSEPSAEGRESVSEQHSTPDAHCAPLPM